MSTKHDYLAVRNFKIVSTVTCQFITDAENVRLGDVHNITDPGTCLRRRVKVIAVAESRLAHKRRSFVVASVLDD